MAAMRSVRVVALLLGAAVQLAAAEGLPDGTTPDPATAPPASDADQPTEIVIQAPEPRYVAPTRRDRIGRTWAPVYINDKGPFRMVLDTGPRRSGVIARVPAAPGTTPH